MEEDPELVVFFAEGSSEPLFLRRAEMIASLEKAGKRIEAREVRDGARSVVEDNSTICTACGATVGYFRWPEHRLSHAFKLKTIGGTDITLGYPSEIC